jgi:membrane associated rhomboid family serine protease
MIKRPKLIPFLTTSALLLVVIHVVNLILAMQLNRFGIIPREFSGLWGVLLHPFLHGNWSHLLNNIVSFSLFSSLVWQFKPNRMATLLILATILPGILVWIFGRSSIHIGLSGVVYFLWAYVVIYGLMLRSIKSVLIAVVVIFLYGSMAWGVLPIRQGMSFETHLFGMIMGAMMGYVFAKRDKKANPSL